MKFEPEAIIDNATNSAPTALMPLGDPEADIDILASVPKQFAIVDEKSANWLVKKIVAAREYSDRVKQWAKIEEARALREEQTLMFLFGRQIEEWAKHKIAEFSGRRKSFALPAGTIGFRAVSPSLRIDNDQLVIDWCKEHVPSAVAVVPKLSRSVLNEHFEKTGEMPEEGAHLDPGGNRFFVR